MKLEAFTAIENYPPKLKALAIKRALQHDDSAKLSNILKYSCGSAFKWNETPEKEFFWSSVNNGQEFEWEEELSYEIY